VSGGRRARPVAVITTCAALAAWLVPRICDVAKAAAELVNTAIEEATP
jgi:hypothetical protein